MPLSAADYLLGVVELAAIAAALGFGAVRVRAWLLPGWSGAPARLVEAVHRDRRPDLGRRAAGGDRPVPRGAARRRGVVVGLGAGALARRATRPRLGIPRAGAAGSRAAAIRRLDSGHRRGRRRAPTGRRGSLQPHPRHVRLRHDLVPHAVRGAVRPGGRRSPSSTSPRPSFLSWFYPGELRAVAQRRDPDHRTATSSRR